MTGIKRLCNLKSINLTKFNCHQHEYLQQQGWTEFYWATTLLPSRGLALKTFQLSRPKIRNGLTITKYWRKRNSGVQQGFAAIYASSLRLFSLDILLFNIVKV